MKLRQTLDRCFVVTKKGHVDDVARICPEQKMLQILVQHSDDVKKVLDFLLSVAKIFKWPGMEHLFWKELHDVVFLCNSKSCFVPTFLLTGDRTYFNYGNFQIVLASI